MNAYQFSQAERSHESAVEPQHLAKIDADEAFAEELEATVSELYARTEYIEGLRDEINDEEDLAERVVSDAVDMIRKRQERARDDYEAERGREREERRSGYAD